MNWLKSHLVQKLLFPSVLLSCVWLVVVIVSSALSFLMESLCSHLLSLSPISILGHLALYLTSFLMDEGWLPLSHKQSGGNQWKFNREVAACIVACSDKFNTCTQAASDQLMDLYRRHLESWKHFFSVTISATVSWVYLVTPTKVTCQTLSCCFDILFSTKIDSMCWSLNTNARHLLLDLWQKNKNNSEAL